MHFFEKQRVDQIGIMSVALQKVLIFLMIVNVFSLFNVGGFLSLLLCIIGFIGAVKRKPCLLMTYFSISVITMVIGFVFGMLMLGMVFYTQDADYYNSGSESSTSFSSLASSDSFAPVQHHMRSVLRHFFPTAEGSTATPAGSTAPQAGSAAPADASISMEWSNSMDGPSSYEAPNFLLTFLFLVLGFFLLYMKMFSLVLAYRLRKMIKAAPVLPMEFTPYAEEPIDNSCADNENNVDNVEFDQFAGQPMPAPFFNQPGYMPFPMQQFPQQFPGSPSMVPPPMMYGQYPVYYSFAPVPPQAPAANEENSKL